MPNSVLRSHLRGWVITALCLLASLLGGPAMAQGGKGKTIELDLGKGAKIKLIRIAAGQFTMGSPKGEIGRAFSGEEQKEVTIANDFYLAESEVTQAQWTAVMGSTPWKGKEKIKEGDHFPATFVTWDDAQAFAKALSNSSKLKVRLPTEAEWEYACRAGTKTTYYFGNGAKDFEEHVWHVRNTKSARESYAHEVKLKKPNPHGLYDMHGNVWEWCEDKFDETSRVMRGGGWQHRGEACRAAVRMQTPPDTATESAGFRVAMDSSK